MPGPAVGSDAWKAQDKGPTVLATCWTVTAVSTLFVIARVYVRGRILGRLQSDDYYVLMAQLCGYISTGLSSVAAAYGNGKHFSLLTTKQQEGVILYTTAAFCPGVISFALPKMAVVTLLTRLLNPGKYHKIFLWSIGIICQLVLFATVGALLGRCMPARALWDFSVKGKCYNVKYLVRYGIFAGAYSAFVDLYLALYPTIVLFRLQMVKKKKAALSFALGIGSISGVVAIYKSTRIPGLGTADFSYNTSDLVIWTVIEGSTIMIACTIPILQPLLELILKHNPFSSNKDSSSRTPRYYEDYSDQKSNIELGRRKPRSKPKDDLGLTIVEDDSQENILGRPGNSSHVLAQANTTASDDQDSRDNTDRANQLGEGKIMRTDVVTVQYETPSQTGDKPSSSTQRWRGV